MHILDKEVGGIMITLTELYCMCEDWCLYNSVDIVLRNRTFQNMAFNEALSKFGNFVVKKFNRWTVWLYD